mmetsp:Transcript_51240/g.121766  ORF Transcript_51240/g.121766 Transcript_51240/m.121766 type:complete len:274 (+) Transcript_51240:407-1228(+)
MLGLEAALTRRSSCLGLALEEAQLIARGSKLSLQPDSENLAEPGFHCCSQGGLRSSAWRTGCPPTQMEGRLPWPLLLTEVICGQLWRKAWSAVVKTDLNQVARQWDRWHCQTWLLKRLMYQQPLGLEAATRPSGPSHARSQLELRWQSMPSKAAWRLRHLPPRMVAGQPGHSPTWSRTSKWTVSEALARRFAPVTLSFGAADSCLRWSSSSAPHVCHGPHPAHTLPKRCWQLCSDDLYRQRYCLFPPECPRHLWAHEGQLEYQLAAPREQGMS